MRLTPLIVAVLFWGNAFAEPRTIVADVALLPAAGYEMMPGDARCNRLDRFGRLTVCNGAWTRYGLLRVSDADGRSLNDTVALIDADLVVGSRRRLLLEPLDAKSARRYGASYKAIDVSAPIAPAARADSSLPEIDAPPMLAGLSLRLPLADALKAMAPPVLDKPIVPGANTIRTLTSNGGALTVVVAESDGVVTITVRSADLGSLSGVRVGDDCAKPRQLWGKPKGATDVDALWTWGNWQSQVHCDASGRVQSLTIAL